MNNLVGFPFNDQPCTKQSICDNRTPSCMRWWLLIDVDNGARVSSPLGGPVKREVFFNRLRQRKRDICKRTSKLKSSQLHIITSGWWWEVKTKISNSYCINRMWFVGKPWSIQRTNKFNRNSWKNACIRQASTARYRTCELRVFFGVILFAYIIKSTPTNRPCMYVCRKVLGVIVSAEHLICGFMLPLIRLFLPHKKHNGRRIIKA